MDIAFLWQLWKLMSKKVPKEELVPIHRTYFMEFFSLQLGKIQPTRSTLDIQVLRIDK